MAVKRKGATLSSSATCVVVTSQTTASSSVSLDQSSQEVEDDLDESLLYDPHNTSHVQEPNNESYNPESSLVETLDSSWEETMMQMERIAEEFGKIPKTNDAAAGELASVAMDCTALVQAMEKHVSEAAHRDKDADPAFFQRKQDLQAEISKSQTLLKNEHEDLERHEQHLRQLQSQLEERQRHCRELTQRCEDGTNKIQQYKQELEEEMEAVDALEAELKQRNRKAKSYFALFTRLTGIKWHYDELGTGVIRGELQIPSTSTLKKFCIDPERDDLNKFQIANKLWDIGEE